MRRLAALALVAAALVGCGGDDDAGPSAAPAANDCVTLGIPAYVGPRQLVRAAAGGDTATIVLNPANGPDVERDDDLAPAVTKVRDAGVDVLGYVATGYGTADADTVVEEAERYERWYGVDGIFLDEVSSEATDLATYRGIADALRAAGFDTIALNPGVYPDAAYLALGDIVVTFEGTAREYRGDIDKPAGFDDDGIVEWHLVHTASELDAKASVDLAAERGASRVFVTDRPEEADTWNALPPYFDDEVRWARRAPCPPSP